MSPDPADKVRARLNARLNRRVRHAWACPDCDADTRMVMMSPGVYKLEVLHDPTCPWLRARERGKP